MSQPSRTAPHRPPRSGPLVACCMLRRETFWVLFDEGFKRGAVLQARIYFLSIRSRWGVCEGSPPHFDSLHGELIVPKQHRNPFIPRIKHNRISPLRISATVCSFCSFWFDGSYSTPMSVFRAYIFSVYNERFMLVEAKKSSMAGTALVSRSSQTACLRVYATSKESSLPMVGRRFW